MAQQEATAPTAKRSSTSTADHPTNTPKRVAYPAHHEVSHPSTLLDPSAHDLASNSARESLQMWG